MYVNLNFSLKNWVGGVFGKLNGPLPVELWFWCLDNTLEKICVKQRPAQNFHLVFQSTGGGYDTKHVFGLYMKSVSISE